MCPDRQPLQVLKVRGAVDYFCQNGYRIFNFKKRVNFVISDRLQTAVDVAPQSRGADVLSG